MSLGGRIHARQRRQKFVPVLRACRKSAERQFNHVAWQSSKVGGDEVSMSLDTTSDESIRAHY